MTIRLPMFPIFKTYFPPNFTLSLDMNSDQYFSPTFVTISRHPIFDSSLNIQHHDRKRISGQICPLDFPRFHSQRSYSSTPFLHRWSKEELRLATGTQNSTYLRHNLKLNSVYHGIPASRLTRDSHGEPLVTTFHSRFMGTVDYIWHTDDLVPVKVLETLPIEILKKTKGLPSKAWGSDHLALVCQLAFADDCVEHDIEVD